MKRLILATLGAAFAALAACHAPAAVIDVGTHVLVPDLAGQTIDISVSGVSPDDDVQGVVFNVQVADGFPDFAPGDPPSTIDGPNITGVDLLAPGSVFGSVANTGQNDIEQREQFWRVGTSTTGGAVLADGLLARLTIDTSGWVASDGPWELKLADTFNEDTNFQAFPQGFTPTIRNGFITFGQPPPPDVIPEPSMLVVAAVLCGWGLFWARRRRGAGV